MLMKNSGNTINFGLSDLPPGGTTSVAGHTQRTDVYVTAKFSDGNSLHLRVWNSPIGTPAVKQAGCDQDIRLDEGASTDRFFPQVMASPSNDLLTMTGNNSVSPSLQPAQRARMNVVHNEGKDTAVKLQRCTTTLVLGVLTVGLLAGCASAPTPTPAVSVSREAAGSGGNANRLD